MLKILITDTDNGMINNQFIYLLGFQPSLGGIIIGKNKIIIFLDSRYFLKTKNINQNNLLKKIYSKENNSKFESQKINKKDVIYIEYKDTLINSINKYISNSKKIILENNITLKIFDDIKNNIVNEHTGKIMKTELIIKKPFFEKQRIIKNKEEIKNIKKAINIIDKVFSSIQKLNKSGKLIGKTELELRSFIITKIFEFGGEGESFESIVAYGSNSAIPHHTCGNTKILNGPLLIDMGAIYNGYCSDFTRTIWVGKTKIDNFEKVPLNPSKDLKNEYNYEEFKKIYNIVFESYKKALNYSKQGVKTKDIDKLARDYITKEGYGDFFIHGLGHGVGLNIHEAPILKNTGKEKIEKGMVFTIEPGIYLPLNFGIRLENMVIIGKDGAQVFSKIEM